MSLKQRLIDGFTKVSTEIKATRALIGPLVNLQTAQKDTVVNALNSLQTALNNVQTGGGSGGVEVNDGLTGLSTTWSSQKISGQITAAVAALVNGAPGTLDTLKELADALGGEQANIDAILTALGNRLRFDAPQALSAPQQQQGQDNLNVYSRAQIGDPETDFVAVINAALA